MDETPTPPDNASQQAITPPRELVPPPAPPLPELPPVPPPPQFPPPPVPPPTQPQPTRTDDGHRGRAIAGIVLILVGLLFYAQYFLPSFNWGTLWPAILIVVGVYIVLRGRRS